MKSSMAELYRISDYLALSLILFAIISRWTVSRLIYAVAYMFGVLAPAEWEPHHMVFSALQHATY